MKLDNRAKRHGIELGKLLTERAGLDPSQVAEDWDASSDGKTVSVTLRVPMFIPVAEFAALNEQADKATRG